MDEWFVFERLVYFVAQVAYVRLDSIGQNIGVKVPDIVHDVIFAEHAVMGEPEVFV